MPLENAPAFPYMAPNRLGTNSLLDLVVFGRRAGIHLSGFVKNAEISNIDESAAKRRRNGLTASPMVPKVRTAGISRGNADRDDGESGYLPQ